MSWRNVETNHILNILISKEPPYLINDKIVMHVNNMDYKPN
jgi:hypothetical protein